MLRVLLAFGLTLTLATPSAARRVVSLNLCADDFLMSLAPEQAVALTLLARDPSLSVVADAARALAVARPDAEAVLALRPDLVLAAPFGAQAVLAVLEAQGIAVERVRLPEDFASIRAETRRLAGLLGVADRGDALVAAMDRSLGDTPPPAGARAVMLEPRGWTAGASSLGHAVLAAAGLRDVGDGRQWSLERLASAPPDLLVVPSPAGAPSLATDWLRHPALAGIASRAINPAWLICGGSWTAQAVAALRR